MWLLLCVMNTFTIHAWKHRKQKDARDATDPQAYPINAHDPSYSLRQSMIPMPRGPFLQMGQSFPGPPPNSHFPQVMCCKVQIIV